MAPPASSWNSRSHFLWTAMTMLFLSTDMMISSPTLASVSPLLEGTVLYPQGVFTKTRPERICEMTPLTFIYVAGSSVIGVRPFCSAAIAEASGKLSDIASITDTILLRVSMFFTSFPPPTGLELHSTERVSKRCAISCEDHRKRLGAMFSVQLVCHEEGSPCMLKSSL